MLLSALSRCGAIIVTPLGRRWGAGLGLRIEQARSQSFAVRELGAAPNRSTEIPVNFCSEGCLWVPEHPIGTLFISGI